MLAEGRHEAILKLVNLRKSVTVVELCKELECSESTIRRDVVYLDSQKLLKKVHGGATVLNMLYMKADQDIVERKNLNISEKERIAKYAAGLIEDNEFIFIDGGSTAELIVDYVTAKNVTFVTTGLSNAIKIANCGHSTIILGGSIYPTTDTVRGIETYKMLEMYNFSRGFLGANAISTENGYSTPDTSEALIKGEAINRCANPYIICDSSKFSAVCAVNFAKFDECVLITNKFDEDFSKVHENVIQV